MASPQVLPVGWTCHNLAGRDFYFHAASNTTRQDPPPIPTYQAATAPMEEMQPLQAQPQPPLPQALQPPPSMAYSPRTESQPPLPAFVAAPSMVQQPVSQPMVNLNVLVPEPGLRPGQTLAFATPAAGPGQQPQQMMVTVDRELVRGSVVSVQYPATATQPLAQPALPQPSVQVEPEEDRRQSRILWALYGSGCLCIPFFCPISMLLWIVATFIYFCKPAHNRPGYPRARVPAYFAAATCCLVLLCAAILIPAAIWEHHEGHFPHHFGPHGPHHSHGPRWLQTFHRGVARATHHAPCRIAKWFKATFKRSKPAEHEHKQDLFNAETAAKWVVLAPKQDTPKPGKGKFMDIVM